MCGNMREYVLPAEVVRDESGNSTAAKLFSVPAMHSGMHFVKHLIIFNILHSPVAVLVPIPVLHVCLHEVSVNGS